MSGGFLLYAPHLKKAPWHACCPPPAQPLVPTMGAHVPARWVMGKEARMCPPGGAWGLNTFPPLPLAELLGHSALRRQMHKTWVWGMGGQLAEPPLHPESPSPFPFVSASQGWLRRVDRDHRKSKATQLSTRGFTRTRRTWTHTAGGVCL